MLRTLLRISVLVEVVFRLPAISTKFAGDDVLNRIFGTSLW
jgi:hypothetical protein